MKGEEIKIRAAIKVEPGKINERIYRQAVDRVNLDPND